MSFAFANNKGEICIGYTDQRGRAVMQRTSCTRLSHAADVADRLEKMFQRKRLEQSLACGEALRAATEASQ